MGSKNKSLKRKNHFYYLDPIPFWLAKNFIFCFGSNYTGDHGPVTSILALKHAGSIMGVSPGRQGKSYVLLLVH